MRIIGSTEIKKFKQGFILKEYLLDEEITIVFIEYLSKLGFSQYFPDFAKPFFRITKNGKFMIKGIQGNGSLQVFYLDCFAGYEQDITEYIASFNAV